MVDDVTTTSIRPWSSSSVSNASSLDAVGSTCPPERRNFRSGHLVWSCSSSVVLFSCVLCPPNLQTTGPHHCAPPSPPHARHGSWQRDGQRRTKQEGEGAGGARQSWTRRILPNLPNCAAGEVGTPRLGHLHLPSWPWCSDGRLERNTAGERRNGKERGWTTEG